MKKYYGIVPIILALLIGVLCLFSPQKSYADDSGCGGIRQRAECGAINTHGFGCRTDICDNVDSYSFCWYEICD